MAGLGREGVDIIGRINPKKYPQQPQPTHKISNPSFMCALKVPNYAPNKRGRLTHVCPWLVTFEATFVSSCNTHKLLRSQLPLRARARQKLCPVPPWALLVTGALSPLFLFAWITSHFPPSPVVIQHLDISHIFLHILQPHPQRLSLSHSNITAQRLNCFLRLPPYLDRPSILHPPSSTASSYGTPTTYHCFALDRASQATRVYTSIVRVFTDPDIPSPF